MQYFSPFVIPSRDFDPHAIEVVRSVSLFSDMILRRFIVKEADLPITQTQFSYT